MLGKLLKNEWKGTYRIGCLMLIVLAGVTFLGWLAFQSPMWHTMYDSRYGYQENFGVNVLNLASVFTLLFYFIMLATVTIGIIAYLGVRFYKTMYTDEGYLTHTLPVTEGNLLFAKTFISGIWILIVSLMAILSVFAICLFMVGALLPPGYTMADFWEEFQKYYRSDFSEIIAAMEEELGFSFGGYCIFIAVSLVVGSFTRIMTLFGAISMGQLAAKHRVLMAIVSYIGITMVRGILNSVIQGIVGSFSTVSRSSVTVGSYINANSIISLVLSVVFAGVLYLISYLVNTRKLNLE